MKTPWYRKYYRCSNGHEWQDEWDCLCNDRCPECNEETEPYDHAEIDLNNQDKAVQDAILYGTGIVRHTPTDIESIPFLMFIRKDWLNATDLQRLSSQNQGNHNPDERTDSLHPTTDP